MVGGAGNDVLIAGDLCGTHNGVEAYDFGVLQAIGDAWATSHAQDSDLRSGADDIVDTVFDQLTGSSGADWFIVSALDKITDINGWKDGDVIEFI